MPSSGCEAPERCHLPLETLGVTFPDFDTELQRMIDNDSETWSDHIAATDEDDDDSVSGNETDGTPPADVSWSPQSPGEESVSTDPVPMDMDQAAYAGDEDFEPVHERLVARRARRGRNVARRGRNRDRMSEEDSHLTPFERGLTFNGFARSLEPEEVTGFTLDSDDGILYSVKWRNYGTRSRQIESSLMRMYRPNMLIDYYEAVARRNTPR